MDIIELLIHAPLVVKCIVGVLLLQALLSLAVVIDRVLLLLLSNRKSREFAENVDAKLEAGDFEAALQIASETRGSHLASYMYTGIRTYLDRRAEGHDADKATHLTERALDRQGEHVSASLNRGMNILASTGSTAPFVGLLGTVVGILLTFQTIAAEGGGGIATIGGQIGEALVVTGLGLVVAIPVVLAFNWLSNKISLYEAGLANAKSELVDRLSGADVHIEAPKLYGGEGHHESVSPASTQRVAVA
ncbi:MAG: MotA/TolQ/ExbB proton channel family protein [Sandaracinus sp.]|nr:MotA/TolQ/ExbB proton channel family protein [Sandaracinus sp.]MCB9613228.1 MotA/TolQ/ExbB proton channel family protein [Sandaracinus sp.]